MSEAEGGPGLVPTACSSEEEPEASTLAASLSNTAALMRHELAGLRIAFSHAGIKGGGGEAIVPNFDDITAENQRPAMTAWLIEQQVKFRAALAAIGPL